MIENEYGIFTDDRINNRTAQEVFEDWKKREPKTKEELKKECPYMRDEDLDNILICLNRGITTS